MSLVLALLLVAAPCPEKKADSNVELKGNALLKAKAGEEKKRPARKDAPAGALAYGPSEWSALEGRIARVLAGPAALAKKQCELTPLDGCEAKQADHLMALVAIEER
jgi:hypothetical protein